MKCNKCGADIIEGIFYNICMPTHKLCIKCKNIMTLEEFDMNCEHIYRPIILKKVEWGWMPDGHRGENAKPVKNEKETFYLYCEKCGEIIKNEANSD